MIRNLIRAIIALFFGGLGSYLNYKLDLLHRAGWEDISLLWSSLAVALVFAIIAFFISPVIIRGFFTLIRWTDTKLQKIPIHELLGGVIGVIIGLIIAALFSLSLSAYQFWSAVISILSLILGYLGLSLGTNVKKRCCLFLIFLQSSGKGDKGEKTKEVISYTVCRPALGL